MKMRNTGAIGTDLWDRLGYDSSDEESMFDEVRERDIGDPGESDT
jgi:hypothetical protein